MMLSVSSGDYSDYQRFRFPVKEGRFDIALIGFRLKRLQELNAPGAQRLDGNDGFQVDEAWWKYWNSKKEAYCTECVEEANLDQALIVVQKETKASRALNYFITSFPNYGYLQRTPVFLFEPSPEKLLQEQGTLLYATVSFILKPRGDPPHPVFCRFYWVERYGKWLPLEFGTSYPGERKWNFNF
jgi:hypothetical protein